MKKKYQNLETNRGYSLFLGIILCFTAVLQPQANSLNPLPISVNSGPVNMIVGVTNSGIFLTATPTGTNWVEAGLLGIPGINTLADIGLTLNNSTGEITGTPSAAGTFTLAVNVEASSNSADKAFGELVTLEISRPNLNIMVVFDRSGSMGWSLGSTSDTREDAAHAALTNMLSLFDNYDESGDKVGVVFFNNSRADYPSTGGSGLQTYTGSSPILGDLGNFPPSGSTCMGGGLLAGRDELSGVEQRHIFLFTDGEQNKEPSYSSVAHQIGNNGIYSLASGWPTGTWNLNSSTDTIDIHTIAIGTSALATDLQDISNEPINGTVPGAHHSLHSINPSDLSLLDNFFEDVFTEILSGFSPAVVNKYKVNAVYRESGTTEVEFNINKTVDRISFKTMVNSGNSKMVNMRVRKGNFVLNPRIYGKMTRSAVFYNVTYKDLDSLGITPEGVWTVELSSHNQGGEPVTVTCIVNDEILDFNTSSGPVIEPGEPIELTLSLNDFGSPVTNVDVANAIVLSPGQDFNDLFSQANSNNDPSGTAGTEPDVSAGQEKFDKLVNADPGFLSALIPKENIITLSPQGNGTYTSEVTGTEESGIYTIYLYVKGNTPSQGKFERFKVLSKVVDFGEPDPEKTEFEEQKLDTVKKVLVITPKNKFGHLIGPARLGHIKFSIDGKPVDLIDNLDGTYTAEVKLPFFKPDPDVNLQIKATDYTELAGIKKYSDIDGTSVTIVDKIKPWVVFILLLIAIIIALYRKLTGSSSS